MINIIERFNLKWVSAESNIHRISYIDYSGNTRNYFADFILENKYLVEIKPKKLRKQLNKINKLYHLLTTDGSLIINSIDIKDYNFIIDKFII